MKLLIQRVSQASVEVEGKTISAIDKGLLIFIGFKAGDTLENCNFPYFIKKCCGLRVFEDDQGKMNLSVQDIGGQILVVSQFTLYAELSKGMRPSFTETLEPGQAKTLYKQFCTGLEAVMGELQVKRGEFGAHMKVHLINDGPGTFTL